MTIDLRKATRWVVNILSLLIAILTLPELGSLVPALWLPVIAAVVAVANLILSWLRVVNTGGESLLGRVR